MHLAVALGLRAIEQGFGVYFVRAQDFFEDLRRAQAEHRLDRRMRVYLAPRLLIIDEFGVWSYDRLAATALFSLISARYERSSVVLTSTKGFGEWGEVLSPAREEAGRALRVSSVPPPTVSEDAADVNRQRRVYSEPPKVGQKYAGVDTGA